MSWSVTRFASYDTLLLGESITIGGLNEPQIIVTK